jgi:hypothetical protein
VLDVVPIEDARRVGLDRVEAAAPGVHLLAVGIQQGARLLL